MALGLDATGRRPRGENEQRWEKTYGPVRINRLPVRAIETELGGGGNFRNQNRRDNHGTERRAETSRFVFLTSWTGGGAEEGKLVKKHSS